MFLKDNKTYFYEVSNWFDAPKSNLFESINLIKDCKWYGIRNNTLVRELTGFCFGYPIILPFYNKDILVVFPLTYTGTGTGLVGNYIWLGKILQIMSITTLHVNNNNYTAVIQDLNSSNTLFLFDPSYFNGSYVFAFLGDGDGLVTYPMKIDYNVKEGTYKLPNGKVVTYGWWVTPTDHPFAYVVSGVEP